MLNRILPLVAACLVLPLAAGPAAAQPLPAPPPPVAAVPSGPPGVLDTPDGWHLNVQGINETQQAVAPLTTALSSREYLVGGTFTGSVEGSGDTKLSGGTLEAGFQIGCGINADDVELIGSAGLTPSIAIPLANNDPAFGASITGQIKVVLKPGTVSIVPVDKKSFKGKGPRITITGFRVKIDGCAGQSFLRSYATLTSSTENTDDVITYLGVTKVV